jgi:hypothetical protein
MSSRLVLHWLKTVVVSDEEKVAYQLPGRDQEGERERTVDEASKNNRRHQNRGVCMSPGRAWRVLSAALSEDVRVTAAAGVGDG